MDISVFVTIFKGVQISDYPYLPEPDNVPVVVMASRLLKDKGVIEFVESAKILKLAGTDVIFRLIGDPDPDNRSGVSESFLNQINPCLYNSTILSRKILVYKYNLFLILN